MARPLPLTPDALRREVDEGTIDTVAVAITDMQGRLQGKRIDADYFVEEVMTGYTEGCNYLMAVDVDMNTVDGYAMSSLGQRLRRHGHAPGPEHPAPPAVAARHGRRPVRPRDRGGRPGGAIPASDPAQAAATGSHEAGYGAFVGTELEFIVFQDSYEEAWLSGYRDLTPANLYNVDYSMLGTARVEPLLRRIRLAMAGAGHGGRERQGRVQPRPARDRLQVPGRARAPATTM